MFFAKVPRNFRGHFKRNGASYITQEQEAKHVAIEPRSKDLELEKMVRDYDPETEAVLVVFWGAQYLKIKMRFLAPLAKGRNERHAEGE